jgi:hypothetical protein
VKDAARALMEEADTLSFSEIVKVTGWFTREQLARMVGAPNWEPETEMMMYRSRYLTLKQRGPVGGASTSGKEGGKK